MSSQARRRAPHTSGSWTESGGCGTKFTVTATIVSMHVVGFD